MIASSLPANQSPFALSILAHVRKALAALVAGVVLGALAMTPAAAQDGSAEGAETFLVDMSEKAIEELQDKSVPLDKREARFQELLEKAFDIDAIARFVLGRYWRAASDDEKQRFVNVLRDVVIQRFLPVFEQYDGKGLTVTQSHKDDRTGLITVSTNVEFQGEPVRIDWRILKRGADYKIVDVVAAGASLAITYQSEYQSFIRQNGGQVAVLIDDLRAKVQRGAFKPESKSDLATSS